MLPEIQQYLDARKAAEDVRAAALAAAGENHKVNPLADRYSDEFHAAYRAASVERDTAYAAERQAYEDAWNALKKSDNTMVSWIAENCEEYKGHALQILEALPATEQELQDIADAGGWCDAWDDLLEQAKDDGAFNDTPALSPELKALRRFLRSEMYRSATQRAMGLARAAIDSAVTAAKAEWSASLTLKKEEDVTPDATADAVDAK